MSETLGIHIGDDGIVGVIADAEADPTAATVLPLGASGPAAARAVAAGPDGTVLVGDAAAGADGPIVIDPLDRARLGRTGALTAVITHVLGRAAIAGSSTSRLAIVVPDDFDGNARDQVVVAANGAGITDVVAVPETAARARASSAPADAIARFAIGAALIGSVDSAPPLVTREDLGEAASPDPSPTIPPPVDTPSGPISVFDESDDDPEPATAPVRQTSSPVAAQPAPRPTPHATHTAPVSAPATHEIPDRSTPIGLIIGVILLLVAIVVVWLLLFVVGGDDDDTATVVPDTTSTTTEPATTTTTEAAVASTSTSTTSSSTTSSTSSTTTSSTTTTSTTTTPVRVASPGAATLSANGLLFEDGTIVQFGQSVEVVLAEATESLGAPDEDTGFEPWEFCIGTRTRFIRWGSLELIFTEEVADSDTGIFTQWYTEGHSDPAGLVTLDGLGESATVGFLEVTFGDALVLLAAFEGDDIGLFAITNPSTGAVLSGITDGLHPEGVVTTLWAGDSCTRVFT